MTSGSGKCPTAAAAAARGWRHVRLRYGVWLFLFLLGGWTTWNSLQTVHSSTYSIPSEDPFHRPPKSRMVEALSTTSTTTTTTTSSQQEPLRQQQYPHPEQVWEPDISGASAGIKTLNHFKAKALLGQYQYQQHHPLQLKSTSWNITSATANDTDNNNKNNNTKKTLHRPTIERHKPKYGKILYFVHIHKSAGSLFCRLAFKNQVNANQEHNCNVQDDQYCCGGQDTMKAQTSYANYTYWDLVATERELYDNLAPDYYDYIVTLRDSKERYYSHWSHLRSMAPVGPGIQRGGFGDSAWITGNHTIVNRRIEERPVPAGVDPLGDFSFWFRGQPDNWNTRILCGAKCRFCAKFQITRQLFEYTLQRANTFAHFLFVEDMETSYNQIAEAYQWQNYSQVASEYLMEHRSNRRRNKSFVTFQLAQEEWDPLMSALDDALYEFAQRKFHHVPKEELWKPFRNQNVVDRYFSEGHSRRCPNACCGNCTAY